MKRTAGREKLERVEGQRSPWMACFTAETWRGFRAESNLGTESS